MSLFARVVAVLRERGTPFAVIGAAALAAHGVSRATRDIDLLVLDRECLTPSYWERGGLLPDVRRGDADDPLAGVVRLRLAGEPPLDVVIGKSAWQTEILERAVETELEGVLVPIAGRVDLILLKLYAGGHQDAWDVAQLLAGPERDAVVREVGRRLAPLPPECRTLWQRIHEETR